jgi:hypothetical protein
MQIQELSYKLAATYPDSGDDFYDFSNRKKLGDETTATFIQQAVQGLRDRIQHQNFPQDAFFNISCENTSIIAMAYKDGDVYTVSVVVAKGYLRHISSGIKV